MEWGMIDRLFVQLDREANDLRWDARYSPEAEQDEACRNAAALDRVREILEAELALWALEPRDEFGWRGRGPHFEHRRRIWYDSFIIDHRPGGVGYEEKNRLNESWGGRQVRLFSGANLADRVRTNMDMAGRFYEGSSVWFQGIGVHLAFTRWLMLDEFVKTASLGLHIGDMPHFDIPVRMLLAKQYRDAAQVVLGELPGMEQQPPPASYQVASVIGMGAQVVPPRQGFYVILRTSGSFAAMMDEFRMNSSRYANGYAGITVLLPGIEKRNIL